VLIEKWIYRIGLCCRGVGLVFAGLAWNRTTSTKAERSLTRQKSRSTYDTPDQPRRRYQGVPAQSSRYSGFRRGFLVTSMPASQRRFERVSSGPLLQGLPAWAVAGRMGEASDR
jgi:hypothetical protein